MPKWAVHTEVFQPNQPANYYCVRAGIQTMEWSADLPAAHRHMKSVPKPLPTQPTESLDKQNDCSLKPLNFGVMDFTEEYSW